MVGFGIRMKGLGCLDRLGMFFFFTICALGLIPIVIADERHLLPPPSFVHSPALLLTASTAVAIPSISPLMRLADLSLRSPAITLSVQLSWSTTTPALRDFVTNPSDGYGPGSSK